jgi:hypothetical protein
MNDRAAERKLQIELNHNFGPTDWYLTLTWANNPTEEFAFREINNFLRRIKALYKRRGIVFKCISTTHCKTQRTNHHLVFSGGVDRDEIKSLWSHGYKRIEHLYTDGDYRKLASYLISDSSKHFRDEDAIFKRRYYRTRNIEIPPTRKKVIKATEFLEPTPPKGYYIDPDSKFEGINPGTGSIYSEYVLLPLGEDSKYKGWDRLKKTRPKPLGHQAYLRDHFEYQVEMDIFGEEA